MGRVLRASAATKYIGVSYLTLYDYTKKGLILAFTTPRGHYAYDTDDLDKLKAPVRLYQLVRRRRMGGRLDTVGVRQDGLPEAVHHATRGGHDLDGGREGGGTRTDDIPSAGGQRRDARPHRGTGGATCGTRTSRRRGVLARGLELSRLSRQREQTGIRIPDD